MTVPVDIECKCGICGQTSKQVEIASTSVFGPPDLDTRPAPLMRNSIDAWIQACPFCGYCSPDISEFTHETTSIVRSKAYQQQRKSHEYPDLANQFLCWSVIQEKPLELVSVLGEIPHAGGARSETVEERSKRFISAGQASLHAAWVCDDAGNDVAARRCRIRAVGLFNLGTVGGRPLFKQKPDQFVFLADLMRRAGRFGTALALVRSGLSQIQQAAGNTDRSGSEETKYDERFITKLLEFEKALIRRRDTLCHSIKDAVKKDYR